LKDTVLFHVQEQIKINKLPFQAHIYFNEQRRSEQTNRFLKKILDFETLVEKQTFQTKKEARRYMANQPKGVTKFFKIAIKDNHIELTRKPNIISKYMANMGVTIMVTNEELVRDKLLLLYREKDYLEKTFDVLKNEFDGKRLRAQSKDAVEGRLFIKFPKFFQI
jgi:transposase